MWIAQVIVEDVGITLKTPYNPSFVQELKYEVPSYSRSWDQATKTWHVDRPYLQLVIGLCQRFYQDVDIDDRTIGVIQASPSSGNWADDLFDALPEHVHPAVYRGLAKALHPDAGGDSDSMKILTEAYARRMT